MKLRKTWTQPGLGQSASILMLMGVTLILAAPASAARISGTFKGYEQAAPQKGVYLHLENMVTHDSYMALTANDGSFSADLPPGVYRVRGERGAILAGPLTVGAADTALGPVSDLAPFAPSRFCHLQQLAPSMLTSPAPSAANIMTEDKTTPLPPVTVRVTSPTLDLSAPAPPITAVE